MVLGSFIKFLCLQLVPPESRAVLFLLLLLPCEGSIRFTSSLILQFKKFASGELTGRLCESSFTQVTVRKTYWYLGKGR